MTGQYLSQTHSQIDVRYGAPGTPFLQKPWRCAVDTGFAVVKVGNDYTFRCFLANGVGHNMVFQVLIQSPCSYVVYCLYCLSL